MVTILPKVKGFGETMGEAIGGGLGQGISKGAEFAIKAQGQKGLALQKNLGKVRTGIKSFLSLYDKNKAFSPEMIGNLEELSRKYIETGLSPDEAISSAYQEMLSSGANEKPEEQSEFAKAFKGDPGLLKKWGIISEEGVLSDIKKGLMKGGRIGASILDFPLQIAKKSNYLGRGNFKTLTDYYDELTEGQGKPTNVAEEYAYGVPFGPPGVAAVHAEKTLESAGLPESVQQAGGILTFLASHRMKIPALKDIIGDAKKVSAKTGQSVEEVLQKAQKESGVNLEKVAAGDAESISTLKNRITAAPEISAKVKETPKEIFNKKAALKERETFGAKLPESPLEEYYDIKAKEAHKEAAKRPETKARDLEVRTRLEPVEEKLFKEVRDQKDQLVRIEREMQKITGTDAEGRVKTLHEYQKKKYQETLEQLKDVQYEMKYARPRPSEAEVDAQIQKSIGEYEEAIRNPSEETGKAFQRQLELDQKYLDRATKLIERGELPGEIRPDTFLKMKGKYLQGYKAAMDRSRGIIRELTGETDPASLMKIKNEKDLVDLLSKRVKRLESDLVNQTDNIKAMRALEKPSGAFYKQQLKSLKKDAALFKDDLFKQRHVKNIGEMKTGSVFKEKSASLGKEVAKNLTKENLEKAAVETGKSKESLVDTLNTLKKETQAIENEVKNGTVTPNSEAKWLKKMRHGIVFLGTGFGVGAVQGIAEEKFGVKLNPTLMRRLSVALGLGSFGATSIGKSAVKDYFDGVQAEELRRLRNDVRAWNRYVDNMRKSHGSAKANRVVKMANQKEAA